MKVSQFGISILTVVLLATNSHAQLIEEKSEAERVAESIMNEGTAPAKALKKLGQVVEKNNSLLNERAKKEVDKYRVRLTIDPLGNIFDTGETEGGTYYQLIVEPAFRNREQLRRDVWSLDLSVGLGEYFSVGTTARITFSRYFTGPNAKLDALTAPVYCPYDLVVCKRKMPLNSNEVKSRLKSGEGFRLEILGDLSIGINDVVSLGTVSVKGKRAAQFLMDLFKFSDKQIRTRFVGIKNSGELELGVGLRKNGSSFFGSSLGFIRRNFSIGFNLAGRRSFDLLNWQPKTLDTMMLDYLFNFSETRELTDKELENIETSEYALDQIYKNIRSGGFLPLFLTFEKGDTITQKLLEKAERAETISKIDHQRYQNGEIKFQQMRVVSYFKGRLESFVRNFEIGAKLFDLASGNSLIGSVSSYVVSYDSELKPHFYLLENSFTRHLSRSMFGRNKYSMQYDVDVLLLSDREKNIGLISDVVVRTDIEDTRMSDSTTKTYSKIINNSLPNKYKNNSEILDVIGTGAKTNTSLVYKTSFGDKAFQFIGALSMEEVRLKLEKYFDQHPERNYMHLPCDQTGDGSPISFFEYTNQKAYEIVRIFDPQASRQQRLEAFKLASLDPVFDRYLVGEFLGSLIQDDAPEDIYSFDVRSSNFESGTKSKSVGANKISPIYEAVSFVKSIINNQSLDLQLKNTTDDKGNETTAPVNGSVLTNPSISQ